VKFLICKFSVRSATRKRQLKKDYLERKRIDMFLSLLTILFVGLKLTNIIDWSWWLVLMPLYLMPIVAIAMVTVVAAYRNRK
jgi:hypothetical protein